MTSTDRGGDGDSEEAGVVSVDAEETLDNPPIRAYTRSCIFVNLNSQRMVDRSSWKRVLCTLAKGGITVNRYTRIALGMAAILLVGAAAAGTYSIPSKQVDKQKVYFGQPSSFDKPGEIEMQEAIEATSEYKELKKKKIEQGTGKYWILLSQASDRVVKAIEEVGESTDYDLIVSKGYLGKLEPAIPADNITELVLKALDKADERKK